MAFAKAGKYWQRSVRVDGRIHTEYLGSGQDGSDLATMDVLIGERRRADRLARLEAEAELSVLAEEEADRGRAVRGVVAACLHTLGFVRYARNPWRKRMRQVPTSPARLEGPAPGVPAPPDPRALKALLKRAQAREPGAYKELADLAKVHPRIVADEFGTDLAWLARACFADAIMNKDPVFDIALETRMDLMIRELAGDRPSPALRLVSEAVVYAWGEHWGLSTWVAMHSQQITPMMLRRQQGAHRRFMSSLRTYARIAALESRPIGPLADLFQ